MGSLCNPLTISQSFVSRLNPHRTFSRTFAWAMAPISYISVSDLSTQLRSNNPPVVVDVRDEDRAGGHIKGSTHVPASTLKRNVSNYVSQWADKDVVVFHCMMSQVRGPSCAKAFAAASEEAVKNGTMDKAPQVMILEGGFQAFAQAYSKEQNDLYENFDERLYGLGWERD